MGTAAEATRSYPEARPAGLLVGLFSSVRSDPHLPSARPRILESLYVLCDPATLPFLRELLTTGHTYSDPDCCEVTRALVMVRRFTGRGEPHSKDQDANASALVEALD